MAFTKRKISLAAAIDKSRLASGYAYVMLLEVDVIDHFTGTFVETMRLANVGLHDGNPDGSVLTFQGNAYAPARFDVQIEEKAGDLPVVSLSAQDINRIIRVKMDAYNGGVGFQVTLHVVHSSALLGVGNEPGENVVAAAAEITEHFLITEASVDGFTVNFKLGDREQLQNPFPRRRQHRDFCPWQYKGAECKYVGVLPSCDRTLQGDNGCTAHVNTENFGGLPALQVRLVS